jgi:rRNA maturation endonuclease Nob1
MAELIAYIKRVEIELRHIEAKMMELINVSTIEEFRNNPNSRTLIVVPRYHWGNTDENQKRLQMQLKEIYSPWYEQSGLLFRNASREIDKQIEDTHKFIIGWIDKTWDFGMDVQPTIEGSKLKFNEWIQPFYDLIKVLAATGTHPLILVPDTNALIKAPNFADYATIAGQDIFTLVIVPTVLQELDELKVRGRDEVFRSKVESVIRRIKGLRQQGSLLNGVTVNRTITVQMIAREPDFQTTLSWLTPSNNDDRIVATALSLQVDQPSAIVVLVTGDINLQNKAEQANLPYLEPPETTLAA